jgi:RHS repeat-associated protein
VEVSTVAKPRHQFVDFEPDRATGYYYMGARVYDPTLRRWLSPDPLMWAMPEIDAADGSQLNLFAYAKNNPTRFTDPSGFYVKPSKLQEWKDGFVKRGSIELFGGGGILKGLKIASAAGKGARALKAAKLAKATSLRNTARWLRGKLTKAQVEAAKDVAAVEKVVKSASAKGRAGKHTVKHAKDLSKIIRDSERVGSGAHEVQGGLAGAAKTQAKTGYKAGGKDHIQKLDESIDRLDKVIYRIKNAKSIPDKQKKRLLEKAQKYRDRYQKARDSID